MTMYRVLQDEHRLQPFRSLDFSSHYQERNLEDWLEKNPDALTDGEPVLIIGRQVNAGSAGTLDLLALDSEGRTLIIELKRAPTPRDIVAQALEYAAWTASLDQTAIRQLAQTYFSQQDAPLSLEKAWQDAFGDADENDLIDLPRLNDQQRVFVVIEGGNERVTAVIRYLRSLGVDITLLEYRYYQTESGEEFLDIEQRIGREQVISAAGSFSPTLEALLASWTPEMRKQFHIFRDCLLAADSQISQQATKTSVSFYKTTRNGRVFLCYFNGSPPKTNPYIAFLPDSLQDRLDLPATLDGIRKAMTPDIDLRQNKVWWTIHYPATEAHTRRIANALIANVVQKLT
jgi:hypothetical protein